MKVDERLPALARTSSNLPRADRDDVIIPASVPLTGTPGFPKQAVEAEVATSVNGNQSTAGGDPPPGQSPTSIWNRVVEAGRRFLSSPVRRDTAVIGLGLIGTGAGIVRGAADIPLPVAVLLGLAVAVLVVIAEKALVADSDATRARLLAAGMTLSVLISVGAYAYHMCFDPATNAPKTYTLFLQGEETQGLRPAGRPGGPSLVLSSVRLFGANSYEFSCFAKDPSGNDWLRLANYNLWVPRRYFSPVTTSDSPKIPRC